jgi:hypothetical protein
MLALVTFNTTPLFLPWNHWKKIKETKPHAPKVPPGQGDFFI